MSNVQDSASGHRMLPRLPADYPQFEAHHSGGYWYYAAFCCDYNDPHWGTIVSTQQISGLPKECDGNYHAQNRSTQSIHLSIPEIQIGSRPDGTPITQDKLSLAFCDDDAVQVMDQINESQDTTISNNLWEPLVQVQNVVFVNQNGNEIQDPKLRRRAYQVEIFRFRADVQMPGPQLSFQLNFKFALADRHQPAGSATQNKKLLNINYDGANPGDTNIIGGMLVHNGEQIPCLVVSR